jgi:plasmid replication initiation protein
MAKKKVSPHKQLSLFVVDAFDVAIKDDMASMEHPFYSLSKNPTREVKVYEHNGVRIEFNPSPKGFPTIYDKDLIIYAISHLISKLEEHEEIPHDIEFNPYDFLKFTNRGTGGKSYDSLVDSIDRLQGSYFRTNFRMNGEIKDSWRGIVDEADIETDERTKKPKKLRIKLSQTVIDTIKRKAVLTLNKDYFKLKKPIERRLYELARKHCGTQQTKWMPYLDTLHAKSGSRAALREFRRSVKTIAKENSLPDYSIYYDQEDDQVVFYPREKFLQSYSSTKAPSLPLLPTWVYEKAREKLPGRTCPYAAEQAWREYWRSKGCLPLDNVVGAYLGFCKNPPVQID